MHSILTWLWKNRLGDQKPLHLGIVSQVASLGSCKIESISWPYGLKTSKPGL